MQPMIHFTNHQAHAHTHTHTVRSGGGRGRGAAVKLSLLMPEYVKLFQRILSKFKAVEGVLTPSPTPGCAQGYTDERRSQTLLPVRAYLRGCGQTSPQRDFAVSHSAARHPKRPALPPLPVTESRSVVPGCNV